MLRHRIFLHAGAAALVILAASLSARGGIIAYTVMDTNGGPGYPVGAAGTFMVPQYTDPGGMPLIKVTLTVIGSSSGGRNTFDNEAPGGGTATVAIGTEVKVTGPIPVGGTVFEQLLVRAKPLNTNSGTVAGDNEPGGAGADFAGTDSISVLGTGSTDTKSSFETGALELSPYIGAGNVIFDFTTTTDNTGSFSSTGGGGFEVAFADIRSIYTATVTYEFLPEPGALGIGSVVGILALRRRGRRIGA